MKMMPAVKAATPIMSRVKTYDGTCIRSYSIGTQNCPQPGELRTWCISSPWAPWTIMYEFIHSRQPSRNNAKPAIRLSMPMF